MVIELREFNDKKKEYIEKKWRKFKNIVIIWPQSEHIFGIRITFDTFCAIKSLKVIETESKKNFLMCGENLSNPYIQGNTVPYDSIIPVEIHVIYI